jgi:hypothetical protein
MALLLTNTSQVLAECGFTCDCREKIQTEFDIVFSDEEARHILPCAKSHVNKSQVSRLRVMSEFPDHHKTNQNGIGCKASAENKVCTLCTPSHLSSSAARCAGALHVRRVAVHARRAARRQPSPV